MHILFTDETNSQPSNDVKFFVYGGLMISNDDMPRIAIEIQTLREKLGYGPLDELKFDTRSKPNHISATQFAEVKNAVIQICIENNCKFIASYVLHNIARTKTDVDRISWGANCLIKSFNEYLKSSNIDDYGFVVADRFRSDLDVLKEKFQRGLPHPNYPDYEPERILGYSATCSGCSHFASAADIVLGSFRYCLNNPQNLEVAKQMYRNIKTLQHSVTEHPFEIRKPEYQSEYDLLKSSLIDLDTIKDHDELPF